LPLEPADGVAMGAFPTTCAETTQFGAE
jgi:hypothetical protein